MNIRKVIHRAKENGSATYSVFLNECSELPLKSASVPDRCKHLPLITDTDIHQYIEDNSDILYREEYCMHISHTDAGWLIETLKTNSDEDNSN